MIVNFCWDVLLQMCIILEVGNCNSEGYVIMQKVVGS